VDSLVLIERLDELMAEAKPIPFTREARVDRDEVYKILDRIRTTLPVEFERARWTGREDSQENVVETQLRQIGASIAELRRVQRTQAEGPKGPPLTAAATEQVREIIEAAERTASGLQQKAASEARRVQEEAQSELKAARAESERLRRESRERAAGEAAAYLRRVEEATKKMLERADAADSEMNGMLARLRGSGGSVIEDLEAITAGLNEIEVRRREKGRAREAASGGRGGSHRASHADSGDGGEAPSRRGFD
jgi:cell division septum initiation protein DivIVA